MDMPDRRRWCVVGDQVTLRVAETQTMHRDIEHYRHAAGIGGAFAPLSDVLEAAVDERAARSGGLVKVFGDDPLGPPYELAILGAAMVVETRLPLRAMISGYVERTQAEAAQRFAQSALQVPVALPVRIDGPRLAERLGRFIEGDSIGPVFERLRIDKPEREARGARRSRALDASLADLDALLVLPSPDDLTPRLRDEVHHVALSARVLVARVRDRSGRAAMQRPSVHLGPFVLLDSIDPSVLRQAIAQVLSQRGPTLTDDAWERIGREEDTDVLRFLLAVALLRDGRDGLLQLQRALFENDALCRYALEASMSDALMAEAAQRRPPGREPL